MAATQEAFRTAALDNPAPAAQEPATPAQVPVDPGTTPEATPTETPPQLSWDSIDLSVLDPATAQFVKEHGLRHSDYTRKTQELADQRKQFEQFGDPETVQQALEFTSRLNDPQELIRLRAEIDDYLATNQVQAQPTNQPAPTDTLQQPYTGLDPATQSRLDAMEQRFAQAEHAAQEAQLVEQMQERLQTQEDAIRKDYPSYSQSHIDAIYKLSPAVGYDLVAAQGLFEELRSLNTTDLVGSKGDFPNAANNVRSDAIITQPTEINTMEAAKAATMARYAALSAE